MASAAPRISQRRRPGRSDQREDGERQGHPDDRAEDVRVGDQRTHPHAFTGLTDDRGDAQQARVSSAWRMAMAEAMATTIAAAHIVRCNWSCV